MVAVGPISPSFQTSNLFQTSRSIGTHFNWPEADRFGAPPPRRGAARALVSARRTFAQLLRAGQRRGDAVRFYPDLEGDGRQAVADIPIEDSEREPT